MQFSKIINAVSGAVFLREKMSNNGHENIVTFQKKALTKVTTITLTWFQGFVHRGFVSQYYIHVEYFAENGRGGIFRNNS